MTIPSRGKAQHVCAPLFVFTLGFLRASRECRERPFLFSGDCPAVSWDGGGASSDRPPKEKTVERDQTRRAVVRDGRSPSRFRRPYSPRGDFGKISVFQGVGASLDSAGRRSLTAAKAANEFTRNCVSGFERKLVTFGRSVIRGFAECFQWHFAYLDPCPFEGAWSYLYRDMERGTLFLYPQARTRVR